MKNEQLGIFINSPFVEYLVGICEAVITEKGQEEKNIIFAASKDIKKKVSLKDVKVRMIKKFDLKDFKTTFKEELTAVNNYNKNQKLGLSHLQILQITYSLNIAGDTSEETITQEFKKLENFYQSK